MKNIILVRHAKSSWRDMSLSDHDRPLNNRGKRDSPLMAEWCQAKFPQIDKFVSSTAKRAKTTAAVFIEAYGKKKKELELDKSLYHADETAIYEVIWGTEANHQSIMLFGHNPGFTYFANNFIDQQYIDNIPTCGIVVLKSSAGKWEDVEAINTEVLIFNYPKKLYANQ